ncbi:MAG: SpoIID/LytB domain-containing protein [Lachnospiraceae bacterium]|nr:SpoIID/LytB domain-containing protein [Lachnospiraceae bacterium]
METRFRIWAKLMLIVLLAAAFIYLIARDVTVWQLKQPKGETADVREVQILTEEILLTDVWVPDREGFKNFWEGNKSEYLDYGTYKQLLGYLSAEPENYFYEKKYKDEFLLLREDWHRSYEKLLKELGLQDVIRQEQVDILCGNDYLAGENQIEEGELLCNGTERYLMISPEFENCQFQTVLAYVRGNRLLTLSGIGTGKQHFDNVWIMECNSKEFRFFDGNYEISLPVEQLGSRILAEIEQAGAQGGYREQIADLAFGEGMLKEISVKREKAGGKLLGLGDGTLELEGAGVLEIADNCIGYRIYDKLQTAELKDLSIGYSFADFVIEDGKVCAFLLVRKETMENIRVAVKNQDNGQIYHPELEFVCSDGMKVLYGEYEDRKEKVIPAGERFRVEAGSEYFEGGRMELYPEVWSGRIEVCSQKRAYGTPSYRGMMEIANTQQGLVLINELPLEEYLYSVVPSEMPASYPMEALKAQAVCARTYGYRYLENPGYGSVGAHVDDSVSYQVYNNIAENVNSTSAVKETSGIVLYYGEEPVNVYYYSTSCGFGSDAGVWNEQQKGEMPYLKSVYGGFQGEGDREELMPEELAKEECFREYISLVDENAFEKEEPWFRWSYTVENLDVSMLSDRLKERYHAAPDKILCGEGEEFISKEPGKIKEIYEICCLKRKEGGVMDELLIDTDQGAYKVISEYNIRYILNQQNQVIRQDGSVYESSTLLPSAYFVIDTVKSKENVIGYTVTGGGYGHGVGMSQNGAKAMGLMDLDWEEILTFYFGDCRIENIYE